MSELADTLNRTLGLGLGATWLRADVAKGLELRDGKPNVDREKGIIYGYSVAKLGPARGHNVELDETTLSQIVELGNKSKSGIKSRFDHPNASNTSMGTFLGRSHGFRRDGDYVRADLYLSEAARESPQGNLYDYTLLLAEKDPTAFGASIVFEGKAEQRLNEDGTVTRDMKGEALPRLARVEKLWAADVVDDPAANPDGLFASEDSLATKMTDFANRWAENNFLPRLLGVIEPRLTRMEGLMSDVKEWTEAARLEAFNAGVKQERERVVGIRKAFSSIFPKPSAAESVVCEEVVNLGANLEDAERTFKLRKLATINAEAPQSAGGGSEDVVTTKEEDFSALPLEERCKKEWDSKPEIRAEFEALDIYTAFMRAKANGQVKIYQK